MKATLLVPLLVLVSPPPPYAAATGTRPTEESLDTSGEDLSEALESIRADSGATGLVAMAIQDGDVAAWGAAGVRAIDDDAALSISDPMHMGSCSKSMTATLAARLVERGVLSWDTTVGEAVPELAKAIHADYHEVTVLQLLRHRGGIAERARPEIGAMYDVLGELEGTPEDTRREILTRVMALPPQMPVGPGFDYSNFGYMLVGTMLESLTGKTWSALMEEELFEPLGMKSAGVGSPSGDGVPVGHVLVDEAWESLPPGPSGALHDAMGPAGLVHCSLPDWGRFVSDHLAGHRGEDGIVSAETYGLLHETPEGGDYAAGWGIRKHAWSWGEGTVLAHNGSDTTWHSVVFAMPEWDLSILVAANCSDAAGENATEAARELMLETLGYRD